VRRRRVLIDSSLVGALLDASDDRHDIAHSTFEQLLVEFEQGATSLYSHHKVVDTFDDGRAAEVLAVCDIAEPGRWLTRAAARAERDHPELDRTLATTLVVMRRWRIGEIATFDPFFREHGVPSVPV